ncbi:MAG: 3'-5' exonuclease [Bacteroidaceae bacterium]
MIVRRTISKEEISQMPKEAFPGRTIVIQTEEEVKKAIDYLNTRLTVGIDSETKPSFMKGQSHKVALLHVSTDDTCFLFRLNSIGLPFALIEFLENPKIIKVGLSLRDDFMALHKRAPFTQRSCIDLQDYVKPFGIQDKSLQKIYAILFNLKISKSQRLSNWEADVMSDAQKIYAATDAWTCLKIYELLRKLAKTGDYEKEKIEEIKEEKKEYVLQESLS